MLSLYKNCKKMAPTKIIGYVLAGIGLVGIVLSNKIAPLLSFLGAKSLIYALVGAVALVAVGIVLIIAESKSSGKVLQAEEEVPIYEGEGKKRKIVGYQKAGK